MASGHEKAFLSGACRRRGRLMLWISVAAVVLAASAVALQTAAAGNGGSARQDAKVASIAILLPGKRDDPGYSGLGYIALQRAAKAFGIKKTQVAEAVDVAAQTETYRSFAQQGFTLVMGWGGQYEDGALKAAKEFPDTFFSDNSGTSGNGKNYSSVDLAGEQWTFLQGWVMGKLTKTGTIGIVAGPCFDASARQANGVKDGAKFANSKVRVIITSLNSFDDPAGAKEAALAQIAEGADLIETNLNTGNLGVFQAAQESTKKGKRVLVTTEFVDQRKSAPSVILTSSVRDSAVTVSEAVRRINSGTFDGKPIRIPLKAKDQGLAPFRGLASNSLYKQAKGIQARIVSGKIKVKPKGACPLKSG